MHKIVTFDDDVIYVSDEQANAILDAMRKQSRYVQVDGHTLAISNIASILEENRIKNTTNYGRLHDGSRVRRVFGEWRDIYDAEVRIDPKYYPEVAMDIVPSLDDYEKFIAPIQDNQARLAEMRRLALPDEKESTRARRLLKGDFRPLIEKSYAKPQTDSPGLLAP